MLAVLFVLATAELEQQGQARPDQTSLQTSPDQTSPVQSSPVLAQTLQGGKAMQTAKKIIYGLGQLAEK